MSPLHDPEPGDVVASPSPSPSPSPSATGAEAGPQDPFRTDVLSVETATGDPYMTDVVTAEELDELTRAMAAPVLPTAAILPPEGPVAATTRRWRRTPRPFDVTPTPGADVITRTQSIQRRLGRPARRF